MRRPPGRHRWAPPAPAGSAGAGHPRRRFQLTAGRKAALIIGATLAASSGVVVVSSVNSVNSVEPVDSGAGPGPAASVDSSASPSGPPATAPASTAPTSPTPSRTPTSARTVSGQQTDHRYATCAQVVDAGLGPYKQNRDPEYRWYVDDDRDGWACERSGRSAVRYRNCAEVRAAGAAPLLRGEPGYGRHLDHDGDGIACD